VKDTWRLIKVGLIILISIAVLVGLIYTGYDYGRKKELVHSADLAVQLAYSKETIELTKGLYSKEVIKYEDLSKLFTQKGSEIDALKKQLRDSQAKLLVAEQVTLTWKRAYEAAVKANQTEEPSKEPDGIPRKRVDFVGDLGPIRATGHTLTDPPEAFLKLEQIMPLVLTLTMAQNRDETWTTYVTSSDENVNVEINVAGVNPLILKEKWYRRFWLDLGAIITGDPGARIGLRYQFDRFSFGADCTAMQTGSGCGMNVGYRIFK
jgi:hypothetical protein